MSQGHCFISLMECSSCSIFPCSSRVLYTHQSVSHYTHPNQVRDDRPLIRNLYSYVLYVPQLLAKRHHQCHINSVDQHVAGYSPLWNDHHMTVERLMAERSGACCWHMIYAPPLPSGMLLISGGTYARADCSLISMCLLLDVWWSADRSKYPTTNLLSDQDFDLYIYGSCG